MAKKILVIDDDEKFLREIAELLRMKGYETIAIGDPRCAVAEAKKERPDIILLDLKMDKLNGFKIAGELKRISRLKNTPIVAITGVYVLEEHRLLMRLSGIKECLVKPINLGKAVSMIESMISKKTEGK